MKVDLTDVPLRDLVSAVYEQSVPQGLGFLHATPGALAEDELDAVLSENESSMRFHEGTALSLDYVKGRACKFTLRRGGNGKLYWRLPWYDHTDEQVAKLCERLGVSPPASVSTHGPACNCSECVAVRDRRQA